MRYDQESDGFRAYFHYVQAREALNGSCLAWPAGQARVPPQVAQVAVYSTNGRNLRTLRGFPRD
jgi:hypothetical protein